MNKIVICAMFGGACLALATAVDAQIKVGVTVSATGPATGMMMGGAILEHASANGVKTIAYIGFNEALGEAFFVEVDKAAAGKKVPLVANERFAPKDTSVTGQVLKLIAAKPDAIVI